VDSEHRSSPNRQIPTVSLRPRIHERGDLRLDAVIDFVTFAAKPMPLVSLLDEAPRRLASIFRADVVSLYLLEGDGDTLVMRGNIGFPESVLGQVRLKVGEGITGMAVEVLRPVSVNAAEHHAGYRYFPELAEERFPVFATVPIIGRRGPLGAVVIQRGGAEPFPDPDVQLLVALAASIAAGVRAAELIDSLRDKNTVTRKTGGGTRKITLPGRPIVAGRVLGAVAALKRPPSHPRATRFADDVGRVKVAFEIADKAIRGLIARAETDAMGADAQFLHTYLQIVDDARLRDETLRLCVQGASIANALGDVARRVVRVAAVEGSEFLEERARDIEDLCDALTMIASTDPRAELPTKAILIGNRLTVFDVLVSARSRPVGIALSESVIGPRNQVLLRLLGLPAMADVGGLFRWVSDGDIALIDGDHGLFVVNPTRSEIASLREERKATSRPPPG